MVTNLDSSWRSGRVRLVRVVVAVGLLALTAWWVIPTHSWERRSPVVWTISDSHGVHRSDLWAIAFVVPATILLLPSRRRDKRSRENGPGPRPADPGRPPPGSGGSVDRR